MRREKPGKRLLSALIVALSGILLLTGCGDHEGLPREPHPVVLIDIGGLSSSVLEQAREAGLVPAIERLSAAGRSFELAFSQSPETRPALVSLLTGLYPATHGVLEGGDSLDEGAPTLAQTFESAGFVTAALSAAGDLGQGFGLERGFGSYQQASGEALETEIEEFLSANKGRDFLLLLHVDLGYALSSQGTLQTLQKRLASFDRAIAAVLDGLDARGLGDQATVVLTSDRGVPIDPEAGPLDLSRTHVPLIIETPGLEPSDSLIAPTVEIVDVMPTLLDLTGSEVPRIVQGESLRLLLENHGQRRYFAFSEAPRAGQSAVVLAGYRLIRDSETGTSHLFDLSHDPSEQIDLASREAHKLEVLGRHLDVWQKSLEGGLASASIVGNDELEELQNLGYIQ